MNGKKVIYRCVLLTLSSMLVSVSPVYAGYGSFQTAGVDEDGNIDHAIFDNLSSEYKKALENFYIDESVVKNIISGTNFKVLKESDIKDLLLRYLDVKSNRTITRGEFVKIFDGGFGEFHGEQDLANGLSLYHSYLLDLQKKDYITESDFTTGDYNTNITRLEMIKIAVRAANRLSGSDKFSALVAIQAGLLSSKNGNLNLDDPVTVREALQMTDNVLWLTKTDWLGKTESLNVDKKALTLIKSTLDREIDPWNRKIRTTNLPKNADDYLYILDDIPNSMYEMKYPPGGEVFPFKPSKERITGLAYNKTEADGMVKNVEEFYKLILNVDYRTIDNNWAQNVYKLMSTQGVNDYSLNKRMNSLRNYVKWVKQKKIILKGSLKVEPSMTYSLGFIYARAKVNLQIIKAPKDAYMLNKDQTALYWGSYTGMSYFKKGPGTNINLYSDIRIAPDKVNADWGEYKVANEELFKNFSIIK
ncbi:hypothetical protein [Paenibacillus medicaginis]|uniref:EF-hand domain-containing protein n=1 Tax=Paenibacillus medicaginis TaxID=1470560 RepID=A0ABV5C1Q5_9BACL